MALPDDIVLVEQTALVLGTAAASTPVGTQTDLITLTSLASGAARQSAKFDLTANRGDLIGVRVGLHFTSAPTAGQTVDFYLGLSHSATAGTGNSGGLSGSDAAYSGYSSNLDNSLKHLIFLGSHICTVQTTVQISEIGIFIPEQRYAMLVVDNNTSVSLGATAANNGIRFTPLKSQVQE
jgi:hypothetical protein